MEAPILSVDRVNKRFGGLVAVKDLSFDVQAGEVIGLMGPNGAGKTTLINVLSGEYKPDSGAVKFKGNDITGLPPHKICHLGIARTYQIPQPFNKLTAMQNIVVAARFGRGLDKEAAENEAAADAVAGLQEESALGLGLGCVRLQPGVEGVVQAHLFPELVDHLLSSLLTEHHRGRVTRDEAKHQEGD